MKPLSASHRWAADDASVSSTVTRSKVERLMTLSTSAVAVCCCSDSRNSLSRRVFSMAILSGKVLHQLDLLIGEGSDFLAVDSNRTEQIIFPEHWHYEQR